MNRYLKNFSVAAAISVIAVATPLSARTLDPKVPEDALRLMENWPDIEKELPNENLQIWIG